MARRIAALMAVVLGLFVLACGASSNATTGGAATAPATSNNPVGVGEKASGKGFDLTVVNVERKAELSDFEKAKQGNTYLVVEVLIEATAETPYNPLYAKVKDDTGVEYNTTVSSVADVLKSGNLPSGDKARGKVIFEIPSSAKGLVLSYQPLVIGSTDTVRVKLD